MDTFDGNYFVPASGQNIQYGRIYCNICVLQKSDSYKMWNERRVRRGCDHMVIGFTSTCAISAYQN